MPMIRFILALTAIIFLSACAQQTSTRTTSFTDPAYQGVRFSSLAIEAEAGLQEREIIERTASARLGAMNMTTLSSLDVMPPTRDYNQATRKRRMIDSGMQGLLVITPANKQIVEDYIPGSHFNPGFTPYAGYGRYGRRDHFGIGGGMNFGGGFYDPGIVLREPQSTYIASIYSLPQFDRVWTAEFSVRGANGMDFNAVAGRFAEVLVRRLGADGLIAMPAR